MWGVFFLPDPHNEVKNWDLLLHHSIFTFDYAKNHIKIIEKGYKLDQYVVQNLKWSGVYMRSTFTNALIQKVLTLVLMAVTGYGVYVITMTKFLSD